MIGENAMNAQNTPIFRIIHIDNLHILLQRGRLYAPKTTPNDGLVYKTIHNTSIQSARHAQTITCGPGGVIHDYVSFYFGARSPMLYQLATDRVQGYREGEDPIIYLVSTAQIVQQAGLHFVFSDGHGIATYTRWFDDLADLNRVDWQAVKARYWEDTVDEPDRQRRKQAEFLIQGSCDWSIIRRIGVKNASTKSAVETILSGYDSTLHKEVLVEPRWYYNR